MPKYHIPKTLYYNITQLAKENNTTITKQIIFCVDYARKNLYNSNLLPQHITEQILASVSQYHHQPGITLRPGYTSPALIDYLNKNQLSPEDFIKYLHYGSLYKRIEERRELLNAKSTD